MPRVLPVRRTFAFAVTVTPSPVISNPLTASEDWTVICFAVEIPVIV